LRGEVEGLKRENESLRRRLGMSRAEEDETGSVEA